jgi:hypothetical protein
MDYETDKEYDKQMKLLEKEKAEKVKAKEPKCGVIEYLKAFNSLFEDN